MDSTPLKNVKLLYVGRLDVNKNIVPVLQQFNEYGEKVECFTIVGDGLLINDIIRIAKDNPRIHIAGGLDNSAVLRTMKEHDYLILPSLYDGWGAVVNEALAVGTCVLCSEACGASILLDGVMRGEAFNQENKTNVIKKWVNRGKISAINRSAISTWALKNLSGKAAAEYFTDIINGSNKTAPWISQQD